MITTEEYLNLKKGDVFIGVGDERLVVTIIPIIDTIEFEGEGESEWGDILNVPIELLHNYLDYWLWGAPEGTNEEDWDENEVDYDPSEIVSLPLDNSIEDCENSWMKIWSPGYEDDNSR